jgi:predicted PhzF superfamily epimerase YddE/YHI9
VNRSVPYWHVDAFSARPLAGNQAAIMLLERWLDDQMLQQIAAENNFADTAFLAPDISDVADWELRWFTPQCEVHLCGHATLASGHVLLARDPALARVTFRTVHSGILEVVRVADSYEVGLPIIATKRGEWEEAIGPLGAAPAEIWRSPDGYAIFLFGSEAEIRALGPDFGGLARLGPHQFICTARGGASDVVSRVFVPGAGVDEDSVTGSAHAALTPFWAARLDRDHFSAHQASQRGGDLSCRLDGKVAWLGGACTTIVEGRFYL